MCDRHECPDKGAECAVMQVSSCGFLRMQNNAVRFFRNQQTDFLTHAHDLPIARV